MDKNLLFYYMLMFVISLPKKRKKKLLGQLNKIKRSIQRSGLEGRRDGEEEREKMEEVKELIIAGRR